MGRVSYRHGALLLVVALLLSLRPAPPAAAQPPLPAYKRLSFIPDAPNEPQGRRDPMGPGVAYDSVAQRYLLIFASDAYDAAAPVGDNQFHMYGQLLSSELGFLSPGAPPAAVSAPAIFRLSETATRTQTSVRRDPDTPFYRTRVAFNSVARTFLVVWNGPATLGAGSQTVDDEMEIFGRVVNANGQPLGAQLKISDHHTPGDVLFDAREVDVVYNPVAQEFLVIWAGDLPVVSDNPANREVEIFARRVAGDGTFLGDPFRVTNFGPDGDPAYDANLAAVSVNNAGEYLLIFNGNPASQDREIYGQRLDATGARIGDIIRITDMGPEGDPRYDALTPYVTHNPDADEFLVVFTGQDLALGETEIYGQRLSATGVELGRNDFRVSDMGTYGSPLFNAFLPYAAYNSISREYMVAWQGDDLFSRDREIHVQRLTLEGEALGIDDRRLSFHGPEGDIEYRAGQPILLAAPTLDQLAVFWVSEDGGLPDEYDFGIVADEYELFGQVLTIPPTVEAVASPGLDAPGVIEEIASFKAEIGSLNVEFSKPMYDPGGNDDPADVTNPNNYRLIEGGPSKSVETSACVGPANDDTRATIAGVTYDAPARRATLTLPASLSPGFYRLIICGSLSDERGRSMDGDGDGLSGGVFQRNFTLLAADAAPESWLVLLYLAADDVDPTANGLQVGLTEPVSRLLGRLAVMPYNPDARIVALFDGKDSGDSKIFVREPDGLKDITARVAADPVWPNFPASRELDTGNIGTLQQFILWARSTYPGTRYSMLSIVDHGGGWAPDLNDVAQPRGAQVVQAGGWRGMSIDVGAGGTSFSTRETGEVLAELGAFGRFDLIFFDACLMGMVESAYEVAPYTSYFLAGQNLLWAELPYERYLSRANLNAGTTPRQLATSIVDLYNTGAQSDQPFSIAAVETARLNDVVGLVNNIGQFLLDELNAGGERAIEAERVLRAIYADVQKFDYDSNFAIDSTDGYVDLADLARRLGQAQLTLPQDTGGWEEIQINARALAVRVSGDETTQGAVVRLRKRSGDVRVLGSRVTWNLAGAGGLAVYLPLGEQDIRPTGQLENGRPRSEPQLAYYTDPAQLAFTRDSGPWASVLAALNDTTPPRPPSKGPVRSPFLIDEPDLDVYLPLLRR